MASEAISRKRFRGVYRGVFPIKVNQLREVAEEIVNAGRPFHYGLEVGSKPELFAALSLHTDNESLIICNGYKDEKYIRAALLGRKLGKTVLLVAEKLSEVQSIVAIAKEVGIEPTIGMRLRLSSKGAGKWAESGGENAKFGLSTAEILAAVEMLRTENLSHCLKLLHFHIGSQVPDILTVKKAVQEATRFYAKLRKMNFNIEFLDVGGPRLLHDGYGRRQRLPHRGREQRWPAGHHFQYRCLGGHRERLDELLHLDIAGRLRLERPQHGRHRRRRERRRPAGYSDGERHQ